jgi:hypothetical protein
MGIKTYSIYKAVAAFSAAVYTQMLSFVFRQHAEFKEFFYG